MTNLDRADAQTVREYTKNNSTKTNNNNLKERNKMTKTDETRSAAPAEAELIDSSEPMTIDVEGISDQNGNKMFRVTKDVQSAEALVQDLVASPLEVWKALAQQGVAMASSAARTHVARLVDELTSFPQSVYVARNPGFHTGAFVMPDGTVMGQPNEPNFRVQLGDDLVDLAQSGTLEGWQSTFRDMVRGQPNFMLAACCAFAGPILRLSPYPKNVGFESYGSSSTGKTTMLDLLASVWGAPSGSPGSLALNWRLTTAGLEAPMRARTFTCLPLDEANSAGFADPKLGAKLAEAVFLLAEGAGKVRYNDPPKASSSLVYFSTSNKPIVELLAGVDRDVLQAVRVRLISVPADMGAGLGVWSSLPAGCKSSGEAIQRLKAALARDHGHAARAFIQRLVHELATDPQALRKRIAALCSEFMDKAEVPPNKGPLLRRAQAFSVLFAAGRLASDWGVIPTKKVREPLLVCFRRSHAAKPGTSSGNAPAKTDADPMGAIRAHAAKHDRKLRDLDKYELPELTDDRLDAQPGFLKTIKGRRYLLLRSSQWDALFGPDGPAVAKQLKGEGRLLARDGLQHQAQVRVKVDETGKPTRSAPEKDRVYAVLMSD